MAAELRPMAAGRVAARPPWYAFWRRERRSWRMFWRVFAAMVATIIVGGWSFAALFGVYQDRATAAALAPLWAEAVRPDDAAAAGSSTRRVEIAVDLRGGEPPARAVDLSGDARMKALAAEMRTRGVMVREIRLDDSLDPPVTWLRIDRGGGASRWAGVVGGLQPSGYGRRLGLGLLALVVIALAVAASMSRWVASPLARLVGQVDGIGRGEVPQVRVRGAREIERLGDALRSMADRRFADEQRLRAMLLGVSHDLRSPLARIRVAAELLDDDAERLRATIVRNVGQADAIIDSFLAYVRAEEESADEPVDLAQIARLAAESAQLPDSDALAAAPVRVLGNATMLGRLVANLIDNAERHGAPPISVEVAHDRAARQAVLRVVDAGPGIAEPERLRRAVRARRCGARNARRGARPGDRRPHRRATRRQRRHRSRPGRRRGDHGALAARACGRGGKRRARAGTAPLARAQRVADQPRRDVDDLDHAVVGHARRADHAQRADDLAVDLVRRRHDRQLLERHDLALAADVDAHALGAAGHLEQAHQLRLLLEQVEQLAQAAHVAGEVLHRQQVALAGDHDLLLALGHRLAAGLHRRLHQRRDLAAQRVDLGLQALAHLLDRQAGVVRVEVVAGLDQLRLRVVAAR